MNDNTLDPTNKELLELLNQNYPMSEEAQTVLLQSIESANERVMSTLDYETQNSALIPVFLAKTMNRLEKAGSVIKVETLPRNTSTYQSKFYFGNLMDIIPSDFLEEEIEESVIEGLVEKYGGKELILYSVMPYVDKKNYAFYTYFRGTIMDKETIQKEEAKHFENQMEVSKKRSNLVKAQSALIELYEGQIQDLVMMSKIELGDDVIAEIKHLKQLIDEQSR